MKRLFDIFCSGLGLLFLSPLLIALGLWVALDSPGGVFFRQVRVGRFNSDFRLWKFRTMATGSDKKGLITVGARDSRVTRAGYFLRKYKLDELPQLINVFVGDMSLVGPRPEVRKYVDVYTPEQMKLLSVRPGITDYASLEYLQESEILGRAADPEKAYIEDVMPQKLAIAARYLEHPGLITDIKIILLTLRKITTQ